MNFFHTNNCVIEKNVTIGDGTKVWYFSHIRETAKIGVNCNIGDYVFIDRGVIIGDNVKIANKVSIYAGTIIRDRVFVGNNVVFTNVRKPLTTRKGKRLDTIIGEDASIGANSTVVAGVKIGKKSTIGEGSVVLYDIPDYTFAAGNPARVKKRYQNT